MNSSVDDRVSKREKWDLTKIKYLLFLVVFSLHSEIIQINSIEKILPHVDKTTWVLFDIDDTLIESAVQAGRAEWFYHEIEELMLAQGVDRQEADALLSPQWDSFMEICPIETPELQTADVVKAIQKKSAASFALTARHPPLSTLTLRQLRQIGIDFSHHAPPAVFLETPHPTHWEEGVLFASMMNPKGTVFRQFIEKSDQKPKKVIFIDDAKRHLESMERELQTMGIEFIGFHYTKSTERPFDPKIASKEYRELVLRSLQITRLSSAPRLWHSLFPKF